MNLLHTGYDLSKIKKIEYVPSKLFQNQFNDKNLLQCNILKIKTENVFSGFNLDNKVNLNISHNDMFKTTNMISKIEKKETDLLKGIDEKGSQSLSKMLGVESKMNIHTYNPEILIQKLKGVSEQNYKLKTMQQSVKNESIEESIEEEEEYDAYEPLNQFISKTDERYYRDASDEDERNFNLLTKSSKKVQTGDIEEYEKSTEMKQNINDYIDPYDDLSKESITNFKNLKKGYSRDYDLALDILLKNQDKDRIQVNDVVFEKYNEILRKNGRKEIDKKNDLLPEFLQNFVKNMITREKMQDPSIIISSRNKRSDESNRQYEMRIKNLDKAKERRKSMKEQNVEFNSLMEKHLHERLDKIQDNK